MYNFVSHYKLNSNSNDSIGTNNGTDTSISYVSGIKWNAASYNGTSSKITLTSSLGTSWLSTLDKYLSVWINPASTGSDRVVFTTTWVNSVWIWFSNAGKIWVRDTGGFYWYETGTSVSDSSWQHFVFQMREYEDPPFVPNRRLDIYKNSSFVETVAANNLSDTWTIQLWVSGASTYFYSWLMWYATFGTWILAQWEINALYNWWTPPDIPFQSNFFPLF